MNNSIPSIEEISLDRALGERYLSYAMSTIMSRSLPDVRDGLKPVHRRILYAMWESGNTHKKNYRKSASAVGYVMMRYHPHGDTAIYDALVRMAQHFAMRYPLVDGQGNFGSIDGDNAAAMRYTESRLSEISDSLMEGLEENAINLQPTYNDERFEPCVLPAAFPNLLANGSTGIAVGMATNIPPHNLGELCEGLRLLIQKPHTSIPELLALVPGPDFPTGGVVIESSENIQKIYQTGRGSMRIRARWHTEKLHGGQYQIIITEIPYQVQKSKLIEKISDLYNAKKIPFLGNIADESDTDIRVVIQPKTKAVDAAMLMESLFRLCDLEVRFSVNMNVVDKDSVPRVMSLKEVLQAFLEHRHNVLLRRSNHRLDAIVARLNILSGFLVAYLNLDEVIRIIRFEDQPKEQLILTFSLNNEQAESILNMRLKALRKLEEMEIQKEYAILEQEQAKLQQLLQSHALQWKEIDKQIKEIAKKFGKDTTFGARRTSFEDPPQHLEIPIEAHIEKEPITIICSLMGWIRSIKSHQINPEDIKYKEGDEAKFIVKAFTTDKIMLYASNGRVHTINAEKIVGGRGFGDPLTILADMPSGAQIVTLGIYSNPEHEFIVADAEGRGFRIKEKDLIAQTKTGKQILNVTGVTQATVCCAVNGDMVAIIGKNRKLIVYDIQEIPLMTKGKGVRLQTYRDGDLSDLITFTGSNGISWPMGSRVRTETNLTPWIGRRGQSGKLAPIGFPRTNTFSSVLD